MCGRVIQSSEPLRLAIVDGLDVSNGRMQNVGPRYNAAPSQELLVIRQNPKTGERSLDLLKWGLIPNWCQDPKGGRKTINAKAKVSQRALPSGMPMPSGAASCQLMASSSGARSRVHAPSSPMLLP
jgi:putative SOS response-associated peptidase YedK